MLGTLLILFCTFLWATDAIFRVPLSKSVDAGTIVLVEHFVCVIATLPLFILRIHEIKRLRLSGWLSLAFIGIVGSAFGTYFFTSSYKYISASITILLQKIQPILAILLAQIFLKERPRPGFYFWAFVALVASTMISVPDIWPVILDEREMEKGFPSLLIILKNGIQNKERTLGISFAFCAAVFWALSTVFGKWITRRVSFPVTSFLRFFFGFLGMFILLAAKFHEARSSIGNLLIYFYTDTEALRSIIYMGLIPGALAMYLYYAGLKRSNASTASIAEMFFPVSAILINWRFLGQSLNTIQVIGMGLMLLSVFLINKGIIEGRGERR